MTDKPLPKNEDAEIATLGSVIIDRKIIEPLQGILQPKDFYSTKHKKIFRTMLDMESKGIPVDIVTLSNELSSKGCLDDIGGNNYLIYLTELTPCSANCTHYATLVKEASRLRKVLQFSLKMKQKIDEGKSDFLTARNVISKFYDDILKEDNDSGIIRLCDEPVPDERKWILEDFIPMGFPTTLYSTGGVGKSYLAIYLSLNICIGHQEFLDRTFHNESLNTLYLDFELDKIELTRRALEVAKAMGLDLIPENFFYKAPETKISNLIRELPNFIKNNDIKFLVIDSMGAAGLDSMDEKSVIEVYSKLRQLGVTTLAVDHQSKMQSQDSPDNKSPFGSVYKYNMSRSVIHLVHEKNIEGGFTVKLVHKKSNFGKLCEEELVDMIFDNDRVYIQASNSISQQEEELLIIKDAIIEMLHEQERVIQKDIIVYFDKTFSKNKLIGLLKRGESRHWNKEKGSTKNSYCYIPINEPNNVKIQKSQKSNYIYNGNTGFLESDMPDEPDSVQLL
jgi:RecA-family ATPase